MKPIRLAPLLSAAILILVAGNCAALPQESQDPLVRAHQLMLKGSLAEAETEARSAGTDGLVMLGDLLVMRGKLAGADSAYRAAISARHPRAPEASAALAEMAAQRGDRESAVRQARSIIDAYNDRNAPVSMHLAAGRAWVLLSVGNAQAPRLALAAFDAAAAAEPDNALPHLYLGNLFLDHYNAPEARASFNKAFSLDGSDARAILGMARVAEFGGGGNPIQLVRQALTSNPSLTGAQIYLARMHLEAESYDSASIWIASALEVDSSLIQAWSLKGAMAWLTGDSAQYRRALSAATALQPRPTEFYAELADAAGRNRRYKDAVTLAQRAVEYDPESVRALGALGTNQLRIGQMAEGRASIERAFQLDAYNLWHKNTLDLLDRIDKFTVIDSGHFRIVAPGNEAQLLSLYILPLLEQAYDSLSARYSYKPEAPVRLEFYSQHADFSVRTVGLAGLGALGVSFGNLLAMDSPFARDKGTFNWGSTAWHELTHTFSLGASNNRVPRWFSEGLSVLEERRTGNGWGADASVQFLSAYLGKAVRPVSRLNEGFLYPRYASEVSFSYYLASLFCEWVEETRGSKALTAMLTAWRDGQNTTQVFRIALSLSEAEVDAQFDNWMQKRFEVPLRSVAPLAWPHTVENTYPINAPPDSPPSVTSGAFAEALATAMATMARGDKSAAIIELEKAQALFPDYAGDDSPAIMLAMLYSERGETRKALDQIVRVTHRNENALEANELELRLREELSDTAGMITVMERLNWIWPYEIEAHVKLAGLASASGRHAMAVRERRAIVALDPPDLPDARAELARALIAAGDIAAARRELLAVLEAAPSFEKAQLLLLELRTGGKE